MSIRVELGLVSGPPPMMGMVPRPGMMPFAPGMVPRPGMMPFAPGMVPPGTVPGGVPNPVMRPPFLGDTRPFNGAIYNNQGKQT